MNIGLGRGKEILESVCDYAACKTIEGPEYGDCLDINFYRIKTTGGTVDIELRVSHNGYYGGWLNNLNEICSLPLGAVRQLG